MKRNSTLKFSLVFFLICFQLSLSANAFVQINVETAGTLPELFDKTGHDKETLPNLRLTGEINGTDIKFIREMEGLVILDIGETKILAGGEAYYSDVFFAYYTKDNVISEEMFHSLHTLTTIFLPDAITTIETDAFSFCTALGYISMGSNVTSIGNRVFTDCSALTSITLPDGVTSIGRNAFWNCSSLTSITLPDGVTSIGESTFGNCRALTSITLPDGVTSIGERAFYGCSSLSEIYSRNPTPPVTGINVFQRIDFENCKLYVPIGSRSNYQEAENWKLFNNIMENDFSSVDQISVDNLIITPNSNGLSVETSRALPVIIYSMSGKTAYCSTINGHKEIKLDKGIYIVNVNNKSQKIVVK